MEKSKTALAEIWRRAQGRARRQRYRLRRDRRRAGELAAELLDLPAERRRSAVHEDRRFASPHLSLLLRTRSRRPGKTRWAAALAELAAEIADRVDPRIFGKTVSANLRIEAWAELALALTAGTEAKAIGAGTRGRADAAVATAESICNRNGRDPLQVARILEVRSSLAEGRRRIRVAIRLARRATVLVDRYGTPRAKAASSARLGCLLARAGEAAEAIPILRSALALIDPESEPKKALEVAGALAPALLAAGEGSATLKILHRARRWTVALEDPREALSAGLDLTRLEGQVAAALGRPREAELAMTEAQKGFAAQGRARDSVLALLDLANLYAAPNQPGRAEPGKLARLGREITPLFLAAGSSADFHLDELAALYLFRRAASTGRATRGFVTQLAGVLRS